MEKLVGRVKDSEPLIAEAYLNGSGPEILVRIRTDATGEQVPVQVQAPQGIEEVSGMFMLKSPCAAAGIRGVSNSLVQP